jgi:hypothetical protein
MWFVGWRLRVVFVAWLWSERKGLRMTSQIQTTSLNVSRFLVRRGGRVPGGGIEGVPMTETGGVFRLGARSANGLSSSMNGEPLNGDVDPKPLVEDTKSPCGGDDILETDE